MKEPYFRDFATFAQKDDKHTLVISADTNEESFQDPIEFLF